jgi:hypothetical protein
MRVAQSLDHFVVPVDDLVIAEGFYPRVFGGKITRRNGLNVRRRKRGAVPHTFIQIDGKRMGVYLQSEERAQPAGARGLPTYSFTTTERGLEELIKELKDLAARFEGPVQNAYSFAKQTLFLTDPAGNHYAVYIPQAPSGAAYAPGVRITAVGYLELEAPAMDASIDFYETRICASSPAVSQPSIPGSAKIEHQKGPNPGFPTGRSGRVPRADRRPSPRSGVFGKQGRPSITFFPNLLSLAGV